MASSYVCEYEYVFENKKKLCELRVREIPLNNIKIYYVCIYCIVSF
jgi:hypothetical protein